MKLLQKKNQEKNQQVLIILLVLKEILGYTLNENKLPENKDGKYTEGKITVTYYYTKNDGTVEEPKVEKTGPNTINSIDGVFNYTISSSAKIKRLCRKC